MAVNDESGGIVISPIWTAGENKPCLPPSLSIIASIKLKAGTGNIECGVDSTGAPAGWVDQGAECLPWLLLHSRVLKWFAELGSIWPPACTSWFRLVVINISCPHVPHVWHENLDWSDLLLYICETVEMDHKYARIRKHILVLPFALSLNNI